MKINKFYIKLFLPIWIFMTISMLIIGVITGTLGTKFNISNYKRIFLQGYTSASASLYNPNDLQPIKKWFKQVKKTQNIDLYLLESNGKIISNAPISKPIQSLVTDLDLKTNSKDFSLYNSILIGTPVYQGKHSYRLAVPIEDIPVNPIFRLFQHFSIRIGMGFIMTLILCYTITRLFTQKIKHIIKHIDTISEGELSIKPPISLIKGKDEFTSLANQVSIMTEKIHALITSKERLLEDISHELKSPLARQQIALEIARKKASSLDIHHLDRIEQENIHMNYLVSEILELAKLNRAERPLHLEKFSLNKLIAEIIGNAHFEVQMSCITFHAKNDAELFADKQLIHRALENIIRNALRYTPAEKRIEISLQKTGNLFKIIISDNGPGVDENALESIFWPFYSAEKATHAKKIGYGLGLAITKQIIELHQGTIRAENTLHSGLTMIITLPVIAS